MKAQLLPNCWQKSAVADAGHQIFTDIFATKLVAGIDPGNLEIVDIQAVFRSIYRKSCASCWLAGLHRCLQGFPPFAESQEGGVKSRCRTLMKRKKQVTLQWHQRWTLYFTISWPDTASVRDLGLWIDGCCCPFILPWFTLPICCTARCFETQDQLEKRIGECFWLVSLLLNVLPLGDKVTCTFW